MIILMHDQYWSLSWSLDSSCDNSASIIMELNETIWWRNFLCTPESGNLRVLSKLATVCWTWDKSPNSIREGVFAAIMWSRHWRAAGLLSDRNLAPFANFVLTSQLCKEMYLTHSGNMEKASQMGPCLFGLYPNGLFMFGLSPFGRPMTFGLSPFGLF